MSSAADRFVAEFGGNWDFDDAVNATAKAAPFSLETLAQPAEADDVPANPQAADGNVPANPQAPMDANLKAKRDLEDELAMHKMLHEEDDDTEGSDSDGSFTYASGSRAPGREPSAPGREPQGSDAA